MMLLTCMLAFTAGFGLNWVWVRCVAEVQAGNRVRAANLSVGIYLLTLVSTALIIEGNVLGVLCYIVGDWMGAYYSVRPIHEDSPADC